MTIERFYKIEALIRVPIDHEFPADTRQAVHMQYKNEATASDLLLEEIKNLLNNAGFRVESLATGLSAYRVLDDETGQVLYRTSHGNATLEITADEALSAIGKSVQKINEWDFE